MPAPGGPGQREEPAHLELARDLGHLLVPPMSAEVVIEVFAEAGPECRAPDSVLAVADPSNAIAETSELNNQATAIIVVESLC